MGSRQIMYLDDGYIILRRALRRIFRFCPTFLFLFSHRVISTLGWQGTHNANHEHAYLEQLDGVLICTNPFIIVVYNTHEKETLSSDHGLVSQVGPVVARGGGSLQLKFGIKNIEKKGFQKVSKYISLLLAVADPRMPRRRCKPGRNFAAAAAAAWEERARAQARVLTIKYIYLF